MKYWCKECKNGITKEEYDYSKKKFDNALCREHQKKEPTKEAKILADKLKEMGWNAELEKWDEHKHIDITIDEAKVHLEIDGIHHNTNVEQAMRDLLRTYYSYKNNYLTLRIPNCLVKNKNAIYETLFHINNFLNERAKVVEEKNSEDSKRVFSFIKRIKFVD